MRGNMEMLRPPRKGNSGEETRPSAGYTVTAEASFRSLVPSARLAHSGQVPEQVALPSARAMPRAVNFSFAEPPWRTRRGGQKKERDET